ncbi:spermidine synthase [Ruegeria sp. Ofav3-42]|uniref:spermidine synthase n=1 Tax=Ruegeria sp. Ofav3-42 TaxID=2917759 RepID=UPI001EF736CD|nr:fused MFS/spermidine synthase [Ruegeria sp. Ofav3-42]MCG7519217.1 fused MFS/spermidine synthase [Ruegeria sp. Ofav3-42]
MLFFQVVLIVGYIYAHLLTKWLPLHWQLVTHLAFWMVALTFLPLSISESWSYDASSSTALQTLELFALGVGLPFAVLSANAPLLQAWYARSGGPSADDPYFLYSASNVGSLLALLAFPLLADPFWGARETSNLWFLGFVVFGGLLLISGLVAIRGSGGSLAPVTANISYSSPKLRQVATWVVIAFVPSSLMLSFTTKVSTDLGSIPLIWVVPLATYILSFVFAFAKWKKLSAESLRIPMVLALAVGVVLLSDLINQHAAPIIILIYVPVLFVIALYAHRLLYEMRPPAEQLTVFYIALSVGGAIGGLFNSIVAPFVFVDEIEAQLTLILASGLLLLTKASFTPRNMAMGLLASYPLLIIFGVVGDIKPLGEGVLRLVVATAVLAAIMFFFRNSPTRIAVLVLVLMLPAIAPKDNAILQDRSFFGTHTVFSNSKYRIYQNGTTLHGWQREEDFGKRPTPLSYYHPEGPMAQVITSDFGRQSDSIGIVGLGTGALACYKLPSQTWAFFEIDTMVDQVARDPSMFTYVSECAPTSETHLGDARIVLAQNPFEFDILVLDAYSSDAIPLHLITKEAVEMYTERLADDGVLVFHVSNRYYDLVDPLARIADALGLNIAHQFLQIDNEQRDRTGASSSEVVIISPDKARIDSFVDNGQWQLVVPDGTEPWTDDKANLLSALKFLKDENASN